MAHDAHTASKDPSRRQQHGEIRGGWMGVPTLVGAVVSERVEEAESEVGFCCATTVLHSNLHVANQYHAPESESVHHTRTQHLLLGCACSRQTTRLAHGCPSAIWGGRCADASSGFDLADRLPEIDM